MLRAALALILVTCLVSQADAENTTPAQNWNVVAIVPTTCLPKRPLAFAPEVMGFGKVIVTFNETKILNSPLPRRSRPIANPSTLPVQLSRDQDPNRSSATRHQITLSVIRTCASVMWNPWFSMSSKHSPV